MTISDETLRIPIDRIVIKREKRQRRLIETKDLEASIRQTGLLQPIIIDRHFELKAGERRLTACRNLGHNSILCRFFDSLDPREAKLVELEENIKRADLPWQDLVGAVTELHRLFIEMDSSWTMTKTAERLSLSVSLVSKYLGINENISDARIASAPTAMGALNIISRKQQRRAGEALDSLLHPDVVEAATGHRDEGYQSQEPSVPSGILHANFALWAPQYSGEKFNLIHCDFPYGANLFGGEQGRGAEPTLGYTDTLETYWNMLEVLCSNLDRLMSVSGHLMFWYSMRTHNETLRFFAEKAPSLVFAPFPLIWVKSDNAGIAADSRRHPRHTYETCLFGARGSRQLVQLVADTYVCPTDRSLHPSCKPEPMLRHFMRMTVDEHTLMFDPTAGSGAALRAAESLGAKSAFGLELDQGYAESATIALRKSRLLRSASTIVEEVEGIL